MESSQISSTKPSRGNQTFENIMYGSFLNTPLLIKSNTTCSRTILNLYLKVSLTQRASILPDYFSQDFLTAMYFLMTLEMIIIFYGISLEAILKDMLMKNMGIPEILVNYLFPGIWTTLISLDLATRKH